MTTPHSIYRQCPPPKHSTREEKQAKIKISIVCYSSTSI